MVKVDLHTHSCGSPDGGLRENDYRQMLDEKKLDYIAITDHNTVSFALEVYKNFGGKVIVGEEIETKEGEIIGLYLKKLVPKGMTASATARAIKDQGGLVYIPHPFETVRKGISEKTLNKIAESVDIIEVCNGRAVFQNFGKQAKAWADEHKVAKAAASDAHGRKGWGRTFTVLEDDPTRENLVKLLLSAERQMRFCGVSALAYPKFNRLRKMLHVP